MNELIRRGIANHEITATPIHCVSRFSKKSLKRFSPDMPAAHHLLQDK